MKKTILLLLLAVLLAAMTGCAAVDEAMQKFGDDMKAAKLDSPNGPQAAAGDFDWSFVPVLREKATETFLSGFPQAQVTDAAVATKSSGSDRVIVTLTYQMDGKTGEYGFDYEKNDQGEYELVRYGDGVNSDDL